MINNYDNLFIETMKLSRSTTMIYLIIWQIMNGMVTVFITEWFKTYRPVFQRRFKRQGFAYCDSCQQNFNLLLTDGYWNGGSPGFGDQDGDGYSNSLADVASYYYTTDLSDLDAMKLRRAILKMKILHQLTVAFGVTGNLSDSWDAYSNPAGAGQDGWMKTMLTCWKMIIVRSAVAIAPKKLMTPMACSPEEAGRLC
ncbi:MAG: hypothetical protein R3F53_17005 [Gammaproteobacteria bacterium]